MQTFRGYEFTAAKLTAAVAAQEPVVLTVGRSKKGRLFVLPFQAWLKAIELEYGEGATDRMRRVTTRTAISDGLSEGVLLGVLMGQVDENWKPTAKHILVVTLGDERNKPTDAAFVVPANKPWRERVEGGE